MVHGQTGLASKNHKVYTEDDLFGDISVRDESTQTDPQNDDLADIMAKMMVDTRNHIVAQITEIVLSTNKWPINESKLSELLAESRNSIVEKLTTVINEKSNSNNREKPIDVTGNLMQKIHDLEQQYEKIKAVPKRTIGWLLPNGQQNTCTFCQGVDHTDDYCSKIDRVGSRRSLCQERGLCSNCLKPHGKDECPKSSTMCKYCAKDGHHESLCPLPQRLFDTMTECEKLTRELNDHNRKMGHPPYSSSVPQFILISSYQSSETTKPFFEPNNFRGRTIPKRNHSPKKAVWSKIHRRY